MFKHPKTARGTPRPKWLPVLLLGLAFQLFPAPAANSIAANVKPALPLASHEFPSCTAHFPPDNPFQRKLESSITTTGTVSLIYIRVRYPEEDPEPVPFEEASRDLTQAASLLDSISYGRCHLQWVITPVYTLPRSRESYTFGDSFTDLINDARSAAQSQGMDYTNYQLDVVRHTGLSNLASGSAFIGQRGLQLGASGPFILLHEIGHNLGLFHANFWNTQGPELPQGSPPLPSDFKTLPDPTAIPVHLNSALGHPSLTGPGQSMEYGDPWDIMGSGADYFSVPNRFKLGWIDSENIALVNRSSIHRLNAPDVAQPTSGTIRALRIPSNGNEFWVELAPTNLLHSQPGLILRWATPEIDGVTDLIQPTLALLNDPTERVLPLGMTFSDPFRNLHITAVSSGGSGMDRWVDVVTELNPPISNRPPAVTITAHTLSAAPNELMAFTATAVDPDKDELSWHWDFDDSNTALTPNQVVKSWSTPGDYVVQLQVSDRKGGVGRAHVTIRVGQPSTAKITGRITDSRNNPISGARVHTWYAEGKKRTLRWMLTDADGRYTLSQLGPGTYTNGAYLFGYRMGHVPPVSITGSESVTRDYKAATIPRVEVTNPAFITEGVGSVAVFNISRTGPVTDPLEMPFHLTGTAEPDRHYVAPLIQSLSIPAGASSATLSLEILDAPGVESWKSIILNLDIPSKTERQRADGTSYTQYFPGLDLEQVDGQTFWTQTDPLFVPGPSASVTIIDNDLRLEISSEDPSTMTLTLRGEPGMAVNVEESSDLIRWTWVSTQFLPRTGLGTLQMPKRNDATQFFRLNFPTN